MKRLCMRLIPALVLGLIAVPLFGQGFQRGGGGGNVSAMMLLNNKGVIEELKLTEDQQEKVKASMKDVFGKFSEDMRAARKDKDQEKVAKLQKEMAAEMNKTVDSALKPEQVKRLKQIEIQVGVQVMGPSALMSEHVEKHLKFTDKQKEAIKEAAEALTKERQEMRKEAGKDREKFAEIQKRIQAKTSQVMEKITSTLSDDQKKAYKELTGAHFDYKPDFGGKRKDI
jgi:hypothetical protein